jgi:hypothetical protein
MFSWMNEKKVDVFMTNFFLFLLKRVKDPHPNVVMGQTKCRICHTLLSLEHKGKWFFRSAETTINDQL